MKKNVVQSKHWPTYQAYVSGLRKDHQVRPGRCCSNTLVPVNERSQLTADAIYEAINEAEVKRKEEKKETVCHLPTHRKGTEGIIPA